MAKSTGKYNRKNTKQNTARRTSASAAGRNSMRYASGNAEMRSFIYGKYGSQPTRRTSAGTGISYGSTVRTGTSRTSVYGRSAGTGYNSAYAYSRSRADAVYSRSAGTGGTNSRRPDTRGLLYNSGSTAYESAYDTAYDTDEIYNTPARANEKSSSKKKVKAAVWAREVAPLSLLKTMFTVFVCSAFVLSVVVFIASNSGYKATLIEAKEQLAQLKEENTELEKEIDDNIDLEEIEKEALKLGLQKPSTYQTVKINVPKESYTVQYGTEEIDEESIGFSEVMSDFKEAAQNVLDKILRVE